MRALAVDASAPERIALREVDPPQPGRDEVLVQVRALSLNRGEVNRIPMAGDGWRPGWDIAGVLPDGTRVVAVLNGGAWAEQVAVPRNQLAPLPDAVSFAQAAALPVAGLTALRVLRFAPRGLLGSRVLITGAAGGVGRFAIQLGRRGGAHITAIVGSEERAAGLRELGADEVVIGHEKVAGRYDLILESAGGASLAHLMTCVDPDGTLVMFGNSANQPTTFNVRDVYLGGYVRLQGFTFFHGWPADPPARDLAYLVVLVAEGALDPQVAGEMPWEEMPRAIAELRERQVPGKLILTIQG